MDTYALGAAKGSIVNCQLASGGDLSVHTEELSVKSREEKIRKTHL